MANDKKNIEVLVPSDDDPTAELEVLDLSQSLDGNDSEVDATTTGFATGGDTTSGAEGGDTGLATDIPARSETVDKLQFDLEVLQAKWRGLTTEVEARDEQAKRLNAELKIVKQALHESEQRIAGRDEKNASDSPTDGQENNQMVEVLAGQLASKNLDNREQHTRLTQLEEYADDLRYKLRLKSAATDELSNRLDATEQQLATASERIATLQTDLEKTLQQKQNLEQKITSLNDTHAEEIRMIRFELCDAQSTLTEHESVAEQLASDLVQTQGVRTALESRLVEVEIGNKSRITALEKENKRLRLEADSMTDQLQTKSEAISALLAELANPSQEIEAQSEIDDAISQLDESVLEHVDDSAYMERERIARLLIGQFDDQELRFPLFKDRLTIGRTRRNDIQLKSQHVSRRHAVVVIEGDVTRVIDWGSKNGVFVNSRRIKEHFLQNGDVVGVGAAEFRYEERPMRDA